jgi:glycosyltransferase involved in cell wall biosynthesis
MDKINLMAPINSLGYGVAGLNITKKLSEVSEVSLFPIGNPDVNTEEDAGIVQQCIQNQESFDAKSPCLRLWHQFSMAEQIGNGLRCGFPIFELDKFNEKEIHHLSSLDKIFVCSKWASDVIKNNGISCDVHVAPLGVDRETFSCENQQGWPETRFVNIGKWEYRKGHDVLSEAFNRAFEASDNVSLYMMNHNPFLNKEQEREWVDLYSKSKLAEKIEFIPRVPTHKQVAEVMSQVDCGVFPSRAEGWNLEAIELLSMGKELIITDYSAHTEFCNSDNSRLISIDSDEDAFDGIWFHGQGQWAEISEPQIDQIAEHMREVHKLKQENGKIHNSSGVETADKFSWQSTAQNIFSEMS